MKRHLSYLPVFLICLMPVAWHGCQTQTTLDRIDSTIIAVTEACDAVTAWADRNAEYVAAHEKIAEQVALIRKELDGVPDSKETLTRLHLLRDAYQKATATEQDVSNVLSQARAFLETARLLMVPTP